MKRFRAVAVALVVLASFWLWNGPQQAGAPGSDGAADAPEVATAPAAGLPAFLPSEARSTLALIQRDGPYPYRQDGSPFRNREGHLPARAQGYYREYTVPTPGLSHRGARRIVTGGDPPQEYWYTDDHYRSFSRFELSP